MPSRILMGSRRQIQTLIKILCRHFEYHSSTSHFPIPKNSHPPKPLSSRHARSTEIATISIPDRCPNSQIRTPTSQIPILPPFSHHPTPTIPIHPPPFPSPIHHPIHTPNSYPFNYNREILSPFLTFSFPSQTLRYSNAIYSHSRTGEWSAKNAH